MNQPPLSPEEAARMLDAIDHRFRSQNQQIMLLALAMLALAVSVAIMQWKLSRDT